jgi:class 3 adenylate cyclase
VIRAYQGTVREAVRRLDGYVAKFMGDGVLVYFGYTNEEKALPQTTAGREYRGRFAQPAVVAS